jgi:membrane associated rhomboid family serine protease
MANLCSICGKKEMLPYKCKFCGWTYCSEHRLPENHDCIGLEKFKEHSRESGKIVYQPVSETVRKRKIGLPFFQKGVKSQYAIPISRNYSLYIIMACVFIYFLQLFIRGFTEFFYLDPSHILIRPWTIVTYMFLHSTYGISHIFFNMMVLFFFGPILERKIGSRNFLIVYFGAGILSALGQMVISPFNPMLGASGAIFGVLAALTILDPNIRVYIFFIIPMKIIHMLFLFALLDLYLLLIGSNDNIAHAAHLFGLLFGLYMGVKLKKEYSVLTW